MHGSLSALRSILTVLWILGVEANEGVGTLVICLEDQTLDASKSFEHFPDVVFSVTWREILRIDIVVNSAEVTLVPWLVLDCLV